MSFATSLASFTQAFKHKLTLPVNRKHELLVMENGEFSGRPAVIPVGIVETQEELDLQKGVTESFAKVFSDWQRISREGGGSNETGDPYSDQAIAAELETWSYDGANDGIVCTLNTVSYVGFISPQRYDDFILEVEVSSVSGDDDVIGLCIAHAVDNNGNSHTLEVVRRWHGRAPMVISKDFRVNTQTIEEITNGLTWSDGVVADGTTVGNGEKAGWSSLNQPIKLKVTRRGDILTIETTQPNSSSYYAPAKTVIDLSADSRLEVFRGPQRFGYICQSQPNSTWNVLQRPGNRIPIVDLRDYTLWLFDDGNWTSTPSDINDLVDRGILAKSWLHINPTTGKVYYHNGTNALAGI